MVAEIIATIEAELAKYKEWTPEWKAVYSLLGKVMTIVEEGKERG